MDSRQDRIQLIKSESERLIKYLLSTSEDYQRMLSFIKLTGAVTGGQLKNPWARYSGTVYVDGSLAPEGTQVRFRIPSQDEPIVDISPLGRNGCPSWSPDGEKIAFHSDRGGYYEIYVMNADGSGQTRLTDNTAWDYTPSWSPDGEKIAFASGQVSNFDIYVMNADGSGQTRLTNNLAWDYNPSWSLDGEKFALDTCGTPPTTRSTS